MTTSAEVNLVFGIFVTVFTRRKELHVKPSTILVWHACGWALFSDLRSDQSAQLRNSSMRFHNGRRYGGRWATRMRVGGARCGRSVRQTAQIHRREAELDGAGN